MTPIHRIVQWNSDAGLLDKPYDDFLESSFQIEEALEGFTDLPILANVLSRNDMVTVQGDTPKDISRAITQIAGTECDDISDVDRLDKACDAIVFAVGSMAKLGLKPEHIEQALNIVMDANQAKLGCPRDEHGKLTKPENFPNPEPRLQALLDSL